MNNFQEILNHVTVYFNVVVEKHNFFDWLHIIISIIATIIIPTIIFKLNTENQKLQALYQSKYEFWLEFNKEFSIFKSAIFRIFDPSNLKFDYPMAASPEQFRSNLNDLVDRWKTFYLKIEGNEKIYLVPYGINILLLRAFISALDMWLKDSNNLPQDLDQEISIIKSSSLRELFRVTRNIFINNIMKDTDLRKKYENYLEKYKNDIDLNSNNAELKICLEEKFDSAFWEYIRDELFDTEKKLLKILDPKDSKYTFSQNIRIFFMYFWKNFFQKIFSVKNISDHKVLTIFFIKIKFKKR